MRRLDSGSQVTNKAQSSISIELTMRGWSSQAGRQRYA